MNEWLGLDVDLLQAGGIVALVVASFLSWQRAKRHEERIQRPSGDSRPFGRRARTRRSVVRRLHSIEAGVLPLLYHSTRDEAGRDRKSGTVYGLWPGSAAGRGTTRCESAVALSTAEIAGEARRARHLTSEFTLMPTPPAAAPATLAGTTRWHRIRHARDGLRKSCTRTADLCGGRRGRPWLRSSGSTRRGRRHRQSGGRSRATFEAQACAAAA
jgi:hypothetical protein